MASVKTTLLLLASQAAAVWLGGVNIAGCDFSIDTNGVWTSSNVQCPSQAEATQQMSHFAQKDGFNVFRIPVAWQSLVNNDLVTNQLDDDFVNNQYDPIIQACLATGAHCIIDIHNYARWWNQIVQQGGPQSSTLATTWSQLAAKYKGQDRIVFGIMNEPHDLDINTWASTLQDSVTAIRNAAGSNTQLILLSGTAYDNLGAFPSQSGPALQGITNPDGSTQNLIFEVHQYFDQNNSGKETSCVNDHSDSFGAMASYLRGIGRQAFVGELGGGNGNDCVDIIGKSLDVINGNGDVFLGWTSWAAGAWAPSYELNEVPDGDQDKNIIASCFAPKFKAGQ